MIERMAGLKLIHSALAIDEGNYNLFLLVIYNTNSLKIYKNVYILDEDDEISYSNEVIELFLKTILKSSSNKHNETQSGYFISMITDLFLEGQFDEQNSVDVTGM